MAVFDTKYYQQCCILELNNFWRECVKLVVKLHSNSFVRAGISGLDTFQITLETRQLPVCYLWPDTHSKSHLKLERKSPILSSLVNL